MCPLLEWVMCQFIMILNVFIYCFLFVFILFTLCYVCYSHYYLLFLVFSALLFLFLFSFLIDYEFGYNQPWHSLFISIFSFYWSWQSSVTSIHLHFLYFSLYSKYYRRRLEGASLQRINRASRTLGSSCWTVRWVWYRCPCRRVQHLSVDVLMTDDFLRNIYYQASLLLPLPSPLITHLSS